MARIKTRGETVGVSYRILQSQKFRLTVLSAYYALPETQIIERLINEEFERLERGKNSTDRLKQSVSIVKANKDRP